MVPRVHGRLASSAMYPAGVSGLTTRGVALRSGLRLRIVESGPAAGAPVLLVHGWGACLYTYRYLLPALGRAGRRAVAVDLRGHGLSDKPRGANAYTIDAVSGDVIDLLDALGIARCDIVGHSLGGRVALHLALSTPQRISRLVLAAPVGLARARLRRIAHLLTPEITDMFARHLTPRWLTSFLLHAAYGNPRRLPDEVVDEYWAPSQFPGYYRALRALLAQFSWEPFPPSELARIAQPALVILGSADRLIPDAERGVAPLPRAELLLLEGGGHLGIEECARESNAAVIRFLKGQEVIATRTTTG